MWGRARPTPAEQRPGTKTVLKLVSTWELYTQDPAGKCAKVSNDLPHVTAEMQSSQN